MRHVVKLMMLAVLVLLPTALLVHVISASSTPSPAPPAPSGGTPFFDCQSLFTSGATAISGETGTVSPTPLVNSALLNLDSSPSGNGGFTPMLVDSMIIVLIMLSLLGILYGIGSAFGINKLVVFVKNEYAETLANVVIITIVMVGGFGLFNNSAIFLSNIASGAVSSSGATAAAPISGSLGTQQMFVNLCNYYNKDLIGANLDNYVGVVYELFVLNIIFYVNIQVMPNGFGVSFAPFEGAQTLRTAIWSEEAMSFALLEMGGMLILMLFIIYFLFPLFFYAGIALRTLPWTRAAGGSLIALFIAFYIIFPAMLYSFAGIGSTSGAGGICGTGSGTQSSPYNFGVGWQGSGYYYNIPGKPSSTAVEISTQSGYNSYPYAAASSLCKSGGITGALKSSTGQLLGVGFSYLTGGTSFGDAMLANVGDFTKEITYSALQFFGVVISFIISYDLLEFLGDVLGAPSLQSNRVLSKVI